MMTTRAARGGTSSTRMELLPTRHARTKGRNGWFTPRALEAVIYTHRDGTPMITLRQFSRRTPANAGAPWESTLPVAVYRAFARDVERELRRSLTRRRSRASDRRITG
jgi:hypothetical protein